LKTMPRLVDNGGLLRLYMVCLAIELLHGFGLTVASLIIYADPSVAGLKSFIPLWALLVYVVTNVALIVYGVALFGVMAKKRRVAIVNNMAFNTLSVLFIVGWHVLGEKSFLGTFVDSLPGLVGLAYFCLSRRVGNTNTLA